MSRFSVCVCGRAHVFAVARGLASPPGTCHINPIPALLSWVNEQGPLLLWDCVPLPQSGADEFGAVLGQRWGQTGGQAEVGTTVRGREAGAREQMWGASLKRDHAAETQSSETS